MEYYITRPADYWIAPNAVQITLNALGDKNRIQGSVASGAVIMCFVESIKAESDGGESGNGDGLWYGSNHEPKRWPLSLSPTYFNSDTHKYVYAAIPRSTSVGTQAMIVFPSEQLDIYGRAFRLLTDDSSDDSSSDDSSDDDDNYVQVGSTDYFYVYLNGIISAPYTEGGVQRRRWENEITESDWGTLSTFQGERETNGFFEEYDLGNGNKAVKLKDQYKGLFAEGFVSAGGVNDEEGGGGGGGQQGSGVLTSPLTVNYNPSVGYVENGKYYEANTPIEDILREMLYKDFAATVSVTASSTQPQVNQQVTLTAHFNAGTSGASVTAWQWYKDGEPISGATSSTYTFTVSDTTAHTFYVVATLSGETSTTKQSNSVTVTGQTRQASVTVTVSATEAEVGDTVTVTAAVALGSTATAVSAITCNGQTMSLSSGTTYTAQPQVQNGANEFEVEVTMNDGTVLTGNVSVTGYYKWFAGKVATQNASEVSIANLEHSGFIKGSPFTIPEFEITDWLAIAVAVPATRTLSVLHAVTDGFTSDMLSVQSYMTTNNKNYAPNNTLYKITDAFADAPTNKSTVKATVI